MQYLFNFISAPARTPKRRCCLLNLECISSSSYGRLWVRKRHYRAKKQERLIVRAKVWAFGTDVCEQMGKSGL